MSDKANNYYKNNYLFAGHRMLLSEPGEKLKNTCRECKFYLSVIGARETKKICAAQIKTYAQRAKQVPREIPITDLMLLLGKEILLDLLKGTPGDRQMACARFENLSSL